MSTIGTLTVKIGADISGLERGLASAQDKLRSAGSAMRSIGAGMTAGITAPLVGIAIAANNAGTALNREMGNVQSLGLTIERTQELKTSVQETAIATGKGTTDIAAGLYQVISAFGDGADTARILEINAKAATAGLATTEEAIALTSAVTKGYGDTSAAAVAQASDLAFVTVMMGQTTFPELAQSIGRVVPLTAALGVSQEELFAVMATGSGVTGSASEVATQMRGTLQALMAPTATMTQLFAEQGYASGEAMLQGLGYQQTILTIMEAAQASNTPLQKYIGSIEGQTLALALAGPLAEAYTQRLTAMGDSAGALDTAFLAQAEGINASGFAAQQAAVKFEVFLQKLDEGLGPIKLAAMDALGPLADKALALADAFADADPATQGLIVGVAAIAAALGPALIVLGSLATALAALASPVGLAIVLFVVLAAVVAANWTAISTATETAIATMTPYWETFLGWIDAAAGGDFGPLTEGLTSAATAMKEMAAAKMDKLLLPNFDELSNKLGVALSQVRVDVSQWFSGAIDPRKLFGRMSMTDLFSGNVALGPGGRIAVKFMGEDFDIDFGAVAAKLTAAATALQTDVAAAFEGTETAIDVSAVTGWVERNTSALRAQISEAMGSDNVLERTISRVQGTLGIIKVAMAGFGGASVAEQFEAVVSSVAAALGALGAIKFDILQTVVDGLTSLGTGLAGLATAGVEKIDAGTVQKLITGWFSGMATQMETLLDTQNLDMLGGAAGKLTATVVEKLGEIFGGPGFGEDVGVAIGKGAVAIAEGATAFTEAFSDALAVVDWSQFGGQIREFVGGMVTGIRLALEEEIRGMEPSSEVVKKQVMEPSLGILDTGLIKGIRDTLSGLLFGSEVVDAQSEMAALGVSVTKTGREMDGLGVTVVQSQSELDGLGVTVAGANTAMSNAATMQQPWGGMGGMGGTVDVLRGPMDVTARVTAVDTSMADVLRPTIDMVAEVTEVDSTKLGIGQRVLQMQQGQQEAAQSSAATAFAGAVEQLNSFNFTWPDLPEWVWPRLPTFTWPSLPRWSWPAIPRPGWISSLQVPRPGWLGELLSWSPIVRVQLGGAPAGLPENALGTRSFAGGPSLVGEHGPELLTLPAGSSIFSANETRAMLAGAGGGDGGGITINLSGMKIEHDLDLESLAYELAARIDRHRRRRG